MLSTGIASAMKSLFIKLKFIWEYSEWEKKSIYSVSQFYQITCDVIFTSDLYFHIDRNNEKSTTCPETPKLLLLFFKYTFHLIIQTFKEHTDNFNFPLLTT